MAYILIHHTGCGSSRKGLALLQENGIEPEIRKYMNKSELLTEDELRGIAKKLSAKSPREFWRAKDAAAAGLDDNSSDDEIFAAMAENPKIIERPIGINGKKAAVGRPNEKLLEIA